MDVKVYGGTDLWNNIEIFISP